MKKLFPILAIALTLTGCASTDYKMYAETQQKIAQAQAMSDAARYAALAEIAKQGDSAAKVAAVMSLNFAGAAGGNNNHMNPNSVMPPKSAADTALQWTSILLPSLTQFYGINANRQVAIAQSNNQAAIAQSTNATFTSMSNNMAKSNSDIAASGFNAATTIATKGFESTTTTAANGLTATTTTATNGLNAATTISNNGLTALTTTAANGLTATSTVANAGITGIVATGANGLTAATNISKNGNDAIVNITNLTNASLQNLTNTLPRIQPNITTTTTTTNNTTNTTTNNGAVGP